MTKKKRQTINDLERDLRGPAQNKYGGHQTQRMKVDRRNTFGPASKCYTYTKEEIARWAAQNGF